RRPRARLPPPLRDGRGGQAGAPAARLPRRLPLHRRPAPPQLRRLAAAGRRHRHRPAAAHGAGEGPARPRTLHGSPVCGAGPGVLTMAMRRSALRWLPWLVAALLLALLAWVGSGPWRTVEGIRQAVKTEDARALAQHVDFPALRASLRPQL